MLNFLLKVVSGQSFCRYDPAIDPKLLIPDDCWVFWDGCNKCLYTNYGMPMCTSNICTYDQMTCPYCMEEDDIGGDIAIRNIP